MYLNITASKDTYIQNKILNNRYRTSDANVGYAGTLDLFKLYNESALPTIEAVTQSEIISIVLPDADDTNIGGKYFTLYDEDDTEYYVWFNVGGASEDPEVTDNPIEVTITLDEEEETLGKIDVAAATSDAIDAEDKFSVVDKETGEIEVTVDTQAVVLNAANGDITDSGFEITVIQQGQAPGTYNLDADSDGSPETAIELSRLFVDFDLSILDDMTTLDTSDGDFKATLYLYDILDGQMAPTNFNVEVFPLAQAFTEGVGRDTGSFSDLDICNFVTASYSGEPILWNTAGADAKGDIGDEDIDVFASSSGGETQLYVSKNFIEGTEKFSFDVTALVKEMLVPPGSEEGTEPNIDPQGFRISFSELEEQDAKTYFLKRFASRHALNQYLRPRLCISWNDSFRDNNKNATFDTDNTLLFRNAIRGTPSFFAEEKEDLMLTLTTGSYESDSHTVSRLEAYGTESVEIDGIYSVVFNEDNGNLLSSSDASIVSSQPEIVRVEFVDHDEDTENLLGYYFTIANNVAEDAEADPEEPATYDFWFGLDGDTVDDYDLDGIGDNSIQITIEAGDTSSTITTLAVAAVNDNTTGLTATAFSLCAMHVTLDDDGEPATLADAGTVPDEDFSVSRYQEGNEITIQDHVVASGSIDFATSWTDSDGVVLHTGTLTVSTPVRSAYSAVPSVMNVSLLNVKSAYKTSEKAKFRVFIRDLNQEYSATKEKLEIDSIIYDEIYYRIRDVVSGDLIIPFERDHNGTRLSTDAGGMYFEIIMSSLFPGRAYTVDLLAVSDGNEIVYECKDTRFRVDL